MTQGLLLSLYISRACKCWDYYRTGKCADKLSDYMGDPAKERHDSYRYYVRTDTNGNYIGDTSDQANNANDFVYKFDQTCNMERSFPRKLNPKMIDQILQTYVISLQPEKPKQAILQEQSFPMCLVSLF